jgi:hypothetical protein
MLPVLRAIPRWRDMVSTRGVLTRYHSGIASISKRCSLIKPARGRKSSLAQLIMDKASNQHHMAGF